MEIINFILEGIQHFLNIIWVLLLISFLLFGGKWSIGNFIELNMPPFLRNSKKAYKEAGE